MLFAFVKYSSMMSRRYSTNTPLYIYLFVSSCNNPFMRKSLVYFIIFFLLGSNIAWAFDADEIFQQSEKQDHVLVMADEVGVLDSSSATCDHCCHGSAHFLGLLSDNNANSSHSLSRSLITVSHSPSSRAYQPPLPPPNTWFLNYLFHAHHHWCVVIPCSGIR